MKVFGKRFSVEIGLMNGDLCFKSSWVSRQSKFKQDVTSCICYMAWKTNFSPNVQHIG